MAVSLQNAYFLKNGLVDWGSCNVANSDSIAGRAEVVFDVLDGQQYKVEWKIRPPSGVEFSIYSPLQAAIGSPLIFQSPQYPQTNSEPGTYSIVWVVVYDQYGNSVWAGVPAGNKGCKNIIVGAIGLNSAYFIKNGSASFDCTATTSDNISFESSASGLTIGQKYKCEWKVRKSSDGSEFSFYSDLILASLLTTFNSTWNAPVTVPDTYSLVWVVIYDEFGIPLWSGVPSCGTACCTITVSEPVVTQIAITKLGNGIGKVTAKIGTIEPGCTDPEITSISVPVGQWVTFKACPAAGSRFVSWQNGSTDPILYAYADAPGSSTVTATFEIDSITISSVLFLRNGVADFDCTATATDNISFTATATGLITGQRYKCEWKTRKDSEITESSFYSDLITASLFTTFNSIWNAPVTVAGTYTITYLVIYNELDIPVWAGVPP